MPNLAKTALKRLARTFGYDIVRLPSGKSYPVDFAEDEQAIIEFVLPYTMTGELRVLNMIRATDYVAKNDVPGAIVECGVWRGGSMMAAAMTLLQSGGGHRDLFLYDTFEGMTEPTDEDIDYRGRAAREKFEETSTDGVVDWCRATLEDVQQAMGETSYDPSRIHLVKGSVEETVPGTLPDEIALLRLDTDWYESTRHELIHMYPRLSSGGVLIIDDYYNWMGQKKAVDEYIAEHGLKLLLNRIDDRARIAIKP